MLYFVFTVDGDFEEYFNLKLKEENRQPKLDSCLSLLNEEIRFAKENLGGKLLHFVHSSPRARDFFLRPEFMSLWKKIIRSKGSIGVHCHEDDPYKEYFYADLHKMQHAIEYLTKGLRQGGIGTISYRGGFLSFNTILIPILEHNKLYLDFSCEPERYLVHNNKIVADWRGAPNNYYCLDYHDQRKPGNSHVFEIPLGKDGNNSFYFEQKSLSSIKKTVGALVQISEQTGQDIIVSFLVHLWDFKPWYASLGAFFHHLKLKKAVELLSQYGSFINAEEALGIISNRHNHFNS